MKKTCIINTLKSLPTEFDLEDFLERLIIIDKIEAGLRDVKEGKTVDHDTVKKMVLKW